MLQQVYEIPVKFFQGVVPDTADRIQLLKANALINGALRAGKFIPKEHRAMTINSLIEAIWSKMIQVMKSRSTDPEVVDSASSILVESLKILSEDDQMQLSELFKELSSTLLLCLQASVKNNLNCLKRQAELIAEVGRRSAELTSLSLEVVANVASFVLSQIQVTNIAKVDVDFITNYALLLHNAFDVSLVPVLTAGYMS